MSFATAADFAAANVDLRIILDERGTLAVDPTTSMAFTQLISACEPGIDRALLEYRSVMRREILRRCQISGITDYDYGDAVLRVLLTEPAEQLAWRLLLRWRSTTILDVDGEVIGYAGAVD